MIDEGIAVALATDYNPGSCHTQSLPMIMTIACIQYGISAAEAIIACTVNSAASLGLENDRAQLKAGYRADIIALKAATPQYIPYHFASNLVTTVIKNGQVVKQ